MSLLHPDQTIGNYRVVDQVAEGDLCEIYRAEDSGLKRPAAIYVLRDSSTRAPEHDALWEREMQVVANLRHPSILSIQTWDQTDSFRYFAAEFVDGSSVADLVAERGPIAPRQAIEWILEAAFGIEYSHGDGFLHRHLSPSKLMVDHGNKIRVLGFGTSPKLLDSVDDRALALRDPYRSPEERDGQPLDERSDIYGLGSTLLFMLTGQPPFEGRNVFEAAWQEPSAVTDDIAEQLASISDLLPKVLTRMTSMNRSQRYESVTDAIQALTSVREHLDQMPTIFISYRRSDTYDATHRLYEKLLESFDEASIFMDVDTIPRGEDFRELLNSAVSKSDVLLAIIGDHWLTELSEDGTRRLDEPYDYVRLEIEAALEFGKPVVPVLVGRAEMPSESEVPATIKEMVFKQAVEIRAGRDYHNHVDRLIDDLREILNRRRGGVRNQLESLLRRVRRKEE